MAAALFLIFLLVASGRAAAVGDDAASLPHLQLRGTTDSGREHASDAPPKGPLMDIMSTSGCGRFAGLVAATPNASETFERRIVTGVGLTVFCPDDLAVAAFEPMFANLSAADQLAVLLHHGAAARYGREEITAFKQVAVRTLAADAATYRSLSLALTGGEDGDTVWLWPYPPPSGGSYGAPARVTKAVSSDDSNFAVYVVEAVLLPSHVRQLVDGGGKAALCTPSPCGGGGYLGWLHCSIKVWQGLCMAACSTVGLLTGIVVTAYYYNLKLIAE